MKAQSKSVPEWSRRCAALTKQVLGHKFGWVFGEPVNPIKLNIPDYFDVIKKPMDLGTVKVLFDHEVVFTVCRQRLKMEPTRLRMSLRLILD